MSNRKTKGIKLSPINTNNGHRKKSSSISKIENNSPLPSNKTKLAPINNAIINRLSQPRKKKIDQRTLFSHAVPPGNGASLAVVVSRMPDRRATLKLKC